MSIGSGDQEKGRAWREDWGEDSRDRAASSAARATSSMESSGSRVVSRCSQRFGAQSAATSPTC